MEEEILYILAQPDNAMITTPTTPTNRYKMFLFLFCLAKTYFEIELSKTDLFSLRQKHILDRIILIYFLQQYI